MHSSASSNVHFQITDHRTCQTSPKNISRLKFSFLRKRTFMHKHMSTYYGHRAHLITFRSVYCSLPFFNGKRKVQLMFNLSCSQFSSSTLPLLKRRDLCWMEFNLRNTTNGIQIMERVFRDLRSNHNSKTWKLNASLCFSMSLPARNINLIFFLANSRKLMVEKIDELAKLNSEVNYRRRQFSHLKILCT